MCFFNFFAITDPLCCFKDFPFQWAVGHDRESILVVLHEKDEHMMKHPDYRSMVLDYLAKAPANKANTHSMQI